MKSWRRDEETKPCFSPLNVDKWSGLRDKHAVCGRHVGSKTTWIRSAASCFCLQEDEPHYMMAGAEDLLLSRVWPILVFVLWWGGGMESASQNLPAARGVNLTDNKLIGSIDGEIKSCFFSLKSFVWNKNQFLEAASSIMEEAEHEHMKSSSPGREIWSDQRSIFTLLLEPHGWNIRKLPDSRKQNNIMTPGQNYEIWSQNYVWMYGSSFLPEQKNGWNVW